MTTLLQAAAAGLRASADVHDAERIPYLSSALRALADALEAYEPVEPGPCPARLDLSAYGPAAGGSVVLTCSLRATHPGLHEERLPDGTTAGRWADTEEIPADTGVDVEAIRTVLRSLRGTVPDLVPMRVAMALEEIAEIVGLDEEARS